MNSQLKEKIIHSCVPPIIAGIAVILLPYLLMIELFTDNTLLLASLVALGFLMPRLRDVLFSIVIYGVAFYAVRRGLVLAYRGYSSDWMLDAADWTSIVQWSVIGLLSLAAAVIQSKGLTVLARRFYLFAISAYFLGLSAYYWNVEEWVRALSLLLLGAFSVYVAFSKWITASRDESKTTFSNVNVVVERRVPNEVKKIEL